MIPVELEKQKEEERGPLIDEYEEVKIYTGYPQNFYSLDTPKLSEKEKKLASGIESLLKKQTSFQDLKPFAKTSPKNEKKFRSTILSPVIGKNLLDKLPSAEESEKLESALTEFLKEAGKHISDPNLLANNILDSTIGYGPISPLIRDPHLEEIMVNGTKANIFVFHRKHGLCKTNIKLNNEQFLSALCSKIARTAQRRFDIQDPLLDAQLPDGNRANATHPYVGSTGFTLTIRKFSQNPLTITQLIQKGTFSSELAAFLWVMVEGLNIQPMNMIISGSAGAGKTTTLNALSVFLRKSDRIISIEDTFEINLPYKENWVAFESRPATKQIPEVTMNNLLRNSLRMRPDRIIVGEVRGEEAQTMFVAMDTGHAGILGTLHANNARETILRLKSAPMDVPEPMLPLLNLIVVQTRMYTKDRGLIRRVSHVAEIARMNEQVLLANIFEWYSTYDKIKKTNIPSRVLEVLSERAGLTKKELMKEINIRMQVLEWMVKNNVTSSNEVETVIQNYYRNQEEVLEMIRYI